MKTPFPFLGLLLLTSLPSVNSCAAEKAFPVTETTVAVWNFNEALDGITNDEANSGVEFRPYSLNGAIPPTEVEGMSGKALFFGGNSALAGGPGLIETPTAVTLEAWIKLDPAAEDVERAVFQNAAYSHSGYRMVITANGCLRWLIEDGVQEIAVQSKTKLPSDEWIHVAGTYDGTTSRIYINGQPEGEKDVPTGNPQGPGGPYVGLISAPDKPFFRGAIQAIRISNTALSAFDLP